MKKVNKLIFYFSIFCNLYDVYAGMNCFVGLLKSLESIIIVLNILNSKYI